MSMEAEIRSKSVPALTVDNDSPVKLRRSPKQSSLTVHTPPLLRSNGSPSLKKADVLPRGSDVGFEEAGMAYLARSRRVRGNDSQSGSSSGSLGDDVPEREGVVYRARRRRRSMIPRGSIAGVEEEMKEYFEARRRSTVVKVGGSSGSSSNASVDTLTAGSSYEDIQRDFHPRYPPFKRNSSSGSIRVGFRNGSYHTEEPKPPPKPTLSRRWTLQSVDPQSIAQIRSGKTGEIEPHVCDHVLEVPEVKKRVGFDVADDPMEEEKQKSPHTVINLGRKSVTEIANTGVRKSLHDAIFFGPRRTRQNKIQRLIESEKYEYRCQKGVYGFIFGFLVFSLLFFFVLYSQGYFTHDLPGRREVTERFTHEGLNDAKLVPNSTDSERILEQAPAIKLPSLGVVLFGLGLVVFASVFVAVSTRMRCMSLLLLPSLCTNRSRAILLTILLQLLITGPVENTIENSSKIPDATACQIEVTKNETGKIKDFLIGRFDTLSDRVKSNVKGTIGSILKVMVGGLGTIRKIMGGFGLTPKLVEDILRKSTQTIDNVTITGKDMLDYDNKLNVETFYNQSNLTSDKSLDQIGQELKQEFKSQTSTIRQVANILRTTLPIYFVLLFLQTYLYYRGYTRRIDYDNVFITKRFKQVDADRKRKGKKSLLPLRVRERMNVIDSSSLCLSMREFKEFIWGIGTVFVFALLGGLLILSDYALSETLRVISEKANTTLTISGGTGFKIHFPNASFSPNIKKWLKQEFNTFFDTNATILSYESLSNTEDCLPTPNPPFLYDDDRMFSLGVMYGAILFLTVLQSYGLRLQHKIASMFYPEQERQRISHLYHNLMAQRISFARLLIGKFRGKSEMHFEDWIAARSRCCGKMLQLLGVTRNRNCVSCGTKTNLMGVGDDWCCKECLMDAKHAI